jgi:hypothetical protein
MNVGQVRARPPAMKEVVKATRLRAGRRMDILMVAVVIVVVAIVVSTAGGCNIRINVWC